MYAGKRGEGLCEGGGGGEEERTKGEGKCGARLGERGRERHKVG